LREEEDVIIPNSGTSSAWVTIRGEEGNRPVLVGRNNLRAAFDLSGAQYVRIENLEITHDDTATGQDLWFREGISILDEPAAHILLQDLYIHHIDEFGMDIKDVEDLQIINCRIEYCGFGALGGPQGDHGGWQNVTIQGCSLSYSGHYYQGGDGSNRPYDRPDGFGIEPSNGPIIIEDTIAEHNYGDGLDSKAANTTIRRCIVANNSCDGVKLWGDNSRVENTLIYGRGDGDPTPTPWAAIVIDQGEQVRARFEIVNVTVDDELGNNYIMYVQYDNPTIPVNLTIRNSIFSGRGPDCPIYINEVSTLVADHNLFYMPQSQRVLIHGNTEYNSTNIGNLGSGNIYGDPLFVNPAWGTEGDYHLQAGSPAINAGTTQDAPTVDLENKPRDAQPDIGAYEF
ncbi:MAG: Parallel beta-helix repeat, partial [bacterium 42_11]